MIAVLMLNRFQPPQEKVFFASDRPGKENPLYVYVDVLSVTPERLEAALRLSFARKMTLEGAEYAGAADRELEVRVSDGYTAHSTALHSGRRMDDLPVSLSIVGNIKHYPLDRYQAKLRIGAADDSHPSIKHAVPLNVTVWQGLSGWSVTAAEDATARKGSLALQLRLHRSEPAVFFALAIFCVMGIVTVAGLVIGSLAFLGKHSADSTLIGALAAMLFALPALRTVVPGAPPLGENADLIFLASEIAVAAGLVLLVSAWILRGRTS